MPLLILSITHYVLWTVHHLLVISRQGKGIISDLHLQ